MSKWLNWKPIDKEKTLLKLMLDLYHNEVDAHYNVEQFLKSNYEGKYAIPEKEGGSMKRMKIPFKKEGHIDSLGERFYTKSHELDWTERGILEDDPEAKIVLDILDLQIRVEEMEEKSSVNPTLNQGESMKKPNLKAFAEKAIHTSCDAFYCEIFFDGEHNEFYGELSCKKKIPKLISYEDGHIQGRFNYLGEPLGDLYLLCSHYAEIGEEYYVFWSHSIHTSEKFGEKDFFDWVVWTPNSEHYNDIKKEQNA